MFLWKEKEFWLVLFKIFPEILRNCTLNGRMESLSSLPGFFFLFFLLIIWFHRTVVGIENYAILNPVVFPVREILDTFLPGLIITSQPLVAGRLSLEFLCLKPHTAVADRWPWRGLWQLPSVMAGCYLPAAWLIWNLDFFLFSTKTCVTQPPEVTSDFWHYKCQKKSSGFSYIMSPWHW